MEDHGSEDEEICTGFPRIFWKSSLETGLFKECQSIPIVFDRHFGEKEAAVAAFLDEKTVFPNFDMHGIIDFLKWGEDGYFNSDFLELC